MRIRFLRWLFDIMGLGKEYSFTVIRKGWLENVARDAIKYPQSKILTIKILRLDGSDFKSALSKYEEMKKS